MVEVKAGDRVCCVGRDGSRVNRFGPTWTGKIYEARNTNRGLVWVLAGTFGGGRSGQKPSQTFIAELQGKAEYRWVDITLKHGQSVAN